MARASVLLVDDDEQILELMTEILEIEGYKIEVALDGPEAIEKISPGKYSAVILDYMMPQMKGDETARRIKRLDPRIGVVLLTGYKQAMDPDRLPEFDYVLEKPVKPVLVLEALSEITIKEYPEHFAKVARQLEN